MCKTGIVCPMLFKELVVIVANFLLCQVITTLRDKPPAPFHAPASEEKAIYQQLSCHNRTITIPADQIQ